MIGNPCSHRLLKGMRRTKLQVHTYDLVSSHTCLKNLLWDGTVTIRSQRSSRSYRTTTPVVSTRSELASNKDDSDERTKGLHQNDYVQYNSSTKTEISRSGVLDEKSDNANNLQSSIESSDNESSRNSSSKKSTNSVLKAYSDLAKARLSALVVLTTGSGFVAAGPAMLDCTSVLASCMIGTALCSSSAAAFNQIIEIERDKRMKRTQNRPLVTGQLSKESALIAASLWGTTGTLLLYAGTDPITAALGAGNIFLYAGVYTYMKPVSIYNTWVGAIVGAIPPVMGWTAATGALSASTATIAPAGVDPIFLFLESNMPAILVASTLYYWQLPHFMALSFMHRADYKRGEFAMLPCIDEKRAAEVVVRYTWYLSSLPVVATLTDTTSSMFAMEGFVLNAYALYIAYKFKNERTNANARKVFLTSLWYLPSVLMLFLLHSKTFDEDREVNKGFLSQYVSDHIRSIRNRGRELCVHETVIHENSNINAAASCPVAIGTQKINETSSLVAQEVSLIETKQEQ